MDIRTVGTHNAPPGQRIADGAEVQATVAGKAAAPVQTVNATLKQLSQDLEFSVDADSQRTIVKVVDQQTKEVIRQMPSAEALEIAKALDRVQGLLIKQKA
jgi:flagellar protein FlaG